MPTEPEVEAPADGLTKGQGNLILFLLAANLLVQVVGWNGLVSEADTIEKEGESYMSMTDLALAAVEWLGIAVGGAVVAGALFLALFVWWNRLQLGRPSRLVR
ncbi:hypothetical protein BH10PSE7_BH10PSE7_13990 [soil metagenome]